jgi:uroporphyrinogen decarboxylase
MNQVSMTSMQRVLTTLGHREPDRVPLFLLLTLHGAKELGLSIKTYFSEPDNVVKGQMRLLAKYRHDCIYSFFYAPVEIEAFGGEVIFMDDGPPNSGEPVIKTHQDIRNLTVRMSKTSLAWPGCWLPPGGSRPGSKIRCPLSEW